MSRLAAFCEKLIEACWLAAIIMAPLFFNVYSSRVFEPDKIALVRTLALIMLAAWLMLRADTIRTDTGVHERASQAPRASFGTRVRVWLATSSRENPLRLPTLLLIASYIISTLASVSPSVSLLGSYQRLQGLYTTLSYIVIFLLATGIIRSRVQVERAISVALGVSFPVAFYGIVQHYFLDPLPWGGDVTTRVASNMGNSIFVGAYLILVVPLTLGRLIERAHDASAQLGKNRALVFGAIVASFVVLAAVWGLSFELGAKKLIDAGFGGTLTPMMLHAAQSNFNLALGVTLLMVLAWWAVAFFFKQRAGNYLLIGVYTLLLAAQVVCLLFTQSRGPLLGFLGGLFTFGILYALVRGARRVALSAVGVALAGIAFLALFNLAAASPLASLRDAPYIGRLGRVFETEGGTGRVRVLIWEGALKLALPHAPLYYPNGVDTLNAIRPLIGYGPETMYVTYNQFYPPELGQIESRNATPDRSHNETFDALVNTGLLGLIAENILFLSVFYYGLKWLGFVKTPRERNAFVALWFACGLVSALVFGAALGWQFIGVALPAGMILGFFIYLVAFALLRGRELNPPRESARELLLIMFLAAIVGHFIEIHFGIAIVSTRTYFWFLSALLVVVGTRQVGEFASAPDAIAEKDTAPLTAAINAASAQARRRRKRAPARDTRPSAPVSTRRREISSAPMLALAFLAGLILATMAFDYINTNSLNTSASQTTTALSIVTGSLMSHTTSAGAEPSYAMLWLFAGTFLVMLAVALAEWGRTLTLAAGEWLYAVGLFSALALAIFTLFIFYHTLLIGTTAVGGFDALLSSVALFVVFLSVMVLVVAVTLLFDVPLPGLWVARATNWLVAPGLAFLAALLIASTNVAIVQADMIYKQAATLASGSSVRTSIELFGRALELQPSQDYYLLFLGRSYLEFAKSLTDAAQRDRILNEADKVLARAQQINPLNTDHSANLARLHQAWAGLVSQPALESDHYKKSLDYYTQATRLSPNTVHLYDQQAQAELEYASFLQAQHDSAGADAARRAADAQIAQALAIDPTFCLTFGTRAQAQADWSAATRDALDALQYAPICGDAFEQEGRALALQALSTAGERALKEGASQTFAQRLEDAAQKNPNVELYTALTNFYSRSGQIEAAAGAASAAIALIPASDNATLQKYKDFRKSLLALQDARSAAQNAPNDPEAHRALAQAWLARSQIEFALAEYQRVAELKPDDYDAQRHITLLLVRSDRITDAIDSITRTMAMAPAKEREFFKKLLVVLDSARAGHQDAALVSLEDLAKSVDPKDAFTLDALNTLMAKLKESS